MKRFLPKCCLWRAGRIWPGFLYCGLLLATAVQAADLKEEAPAPITQTPAAGSFEQNASGDFVGRFTSATTQLRLISDGANMRGTLKLKGEDHPVRGGVKASTFAGEFTDNAQPVPFTATVEGDEMTFTLDPEGAKPRTEILQRQRLRLPQGVWCSDKVEINFENKSGLPSGTLKYNKRDFTFTGTLLADEMEGKLTDGRGNFSFSLVAKGDRLVFMSGPFASELESKARHEATEQARRKLAALDEVLRKSMAVPPVFTNSLGQAFVSVPGTKVLFCIWETRVKDFQAFVDATGRTWLKPYFNQDPTHPAVKVSWNDAQDFCDWLTKKEREKARINHNALYRLPTDAEWSKAVGLPEETGATPEARNLGIENVYPWGTRWPPPNGAGNFADRPAKRTADIFANTEGYHDDYAETSPVGSFKPNQFGIYDLGGNVWEWCEDWFNDENVARVLRGGSWYFCDPDILLSANRIDLPPSSRRGSIGFRCVLVGWTSPWLER